MPPKKADMQADIEDLVARVDGWGNTFDSLTRAVNQTNENLTKLMSNQATFRDSTTLWQDTIKQDIQSLAGRTEKVEQLIAEHKKDVTEIRGTIAQEKDATMKELFEIESKRPNVILMGVPEPDRSLAATPHDQDVQKVNEIFEIMAGEKKAFQMQRRIGQRGEKPRPVLIRMPTTLDKEFILSKGKVLKDNPQWKNVVVKPDMTKNQRDYAQKLGDNLAAVAVTRNADLKNGENFKWVVRGRGVKPSLGKATVAQA